MTTIDITEFEGYDLDEFREFLQTEKDGEYEVIIPKETVLFNSTNEDISWEFAIAAYIGQQLNNISDKFSYSGASLADPGEFTFEIKTTKLDALADLLLEISSVFGNEEIREPIDFTSEVRGFMEDYKDKEVACQDLFETAYEYHTEQEDDD